MESEHVSTAPVDFAEGDGSHAGPFKPEAEAADSGEEVKNPHECESMWKGDSL